MTTQYVAARAQKDELATSRLVAFSFRTGSHTRALCEDSRRKCWRQKEVLGRQRESLARQRRKQRGPALAAVGNSVG